MNTLALILVLTSWVALLAGLAFLSNATSGVGGIAVACFLAILARITQANAHHDEVRKLLSDARAAPPAAASMTTLGKANPLLTADQIQCAKCGLIATRGPATCPQCQSPYASTPHTAVDRLPPIPNQMR